MEDTPGNSDAEDSQDSRFSPHHPDDEMPYETAPRIRRPSWDPEDKSAIKRLPIKLADGRIRQTGVHLSTLQTDSEDEKEEQQHEERFQEATRVEDVSTGARFGRAAVVDVVGIQLKKERIQRAKEQIAGVCQEIISDPENNVSCMKYISKQFIYTGALAGPFKTSPLLLLEGNFDPNPSRSRVNRSAYQKAGHSFPTGGVQGYHSGIQNSRPH
jgi:hypothetical protein